MTFHQEDYCIQVQAIALTCVEKIIDKLEKTNILDEVLPMLGKAKLQDPAILMPVVRIYKHMLGEKKYGLTVNLLATKVMPVLIPVVVSPGLKLDQFTSLVELLREMLDHVARNQRNKLKLEKLSSTEILKKDQLRIDSNGFGKSPFQEGNEPNLPTTFSTTAEQSASYPHRPPTLRLESRRQSISVDDVARRSSGANGGSEASSPDSNLLRVQATLPGRRHSDNTIQPPRILIAPSSPDGSYTPAGVQMRRHSSVCPQDVRFQFSSQKMSPSPIVTTPNVGMDFLSSGRSNMRRYSAAALYASSGVPATCNSRGPSPAGSASSLLQQIGSGVVRNYFMCNCYWMNSFNFMFIGKFISCNTIAKENIVALWSR
ncbi:SCY1-like protein 2 [Trichonephila inaurata madagascariensis]|uniref:SCY1-like protein 2 n=1 Tax=Trichonephila inaurata madagascariensis TaxID=2747483 RepID=A0A8X6YA34_9ARAC|nr:SCY1-like protein 2 [Trichonephila inaurata madagascariensis]